MPITDRAALRRCLLALVSRHGSPAVDRFIQSILSPAQEKG